MFGKDRTPFLYCFLNNIQCYLQSISNELSQQPRTTSDIFNKRDPPEADKSPFHSDKGSLQTAGYRIGS
jgi:hypothetical protein